MSSEASGPPPGALALDIATAHWRSNAISTFVELRLPDTLHALGGVNSPDAPFISPADIAAAAGTHAEITGRLLRYLATFGLVTENADGCYRLAPVGDVCREDHPKSVASMVRWESGVISHKMWQALPTVVKSGQHDVAGALQHSDNNLFSYLDTDNKWHPIFHEAMSGLSRILHDAIVNPARCPLHDLAARHDTICDLGCAFGQLAVSLHERFPSASYILADLPHQVSQLDMAAYPEGFTKAECDFFKSVPKADAYVLKFILHDWDDADCGHILKTVQAANPNATLYVIEHGPMTGPNEPHMAKGFDMHMAVMLGAKERTVEEYKAVYEAAGYCLDATHLLDGGANPLFIMEVKPVV